MVSARSQPVTSGAEPSRHMRKLGLEEALRRKSGDRYEAVRRAFISALQRRRNLT
jgi:hypothetical protein